jgi:sugar phosphate isomerase/epimerase
MAATGARYLNGATIMTTPTPRQLEVARALGYAGIEARAERLLLDPDELAATADAGRNGEVWSLNGVRIGLTQDGALERATLDADLEARLEICRRIGAAYLLAVPPRVPGLDLETAIHGIREGIAVASERAARDGVRIAFEFLGFADCPIGSPAAAAVVIDGIGDVDLVLDSCHWHASGGGSLDAFPVERLAMVHLNDAPAKPPREIEDADRVLPGEGVISLPELVAALRERGYSGPWSLETFNPSFWEEEPAVVARRGWAALEALLGAGD